MTSSSKKQRPVSVLIVDDHAVIRSGLKLLIETSPDLRVCGEFGSGDAAVAAAEGTQPDVVLLDLDLNGEDGLAYVPALLAAARGAKVLVLTGVTDPRINAAAIRAGALGLVHKEKAADVLLKAIRKVNEGEVWFDRAAMGSVLSEMSRGTNGKLDPEAPKIAALTEREREVVTLIGEGLKNRQIAERLFISETTVRHHLTSIFDKLGVSDRLELVIYAYRTGLAAPPK